MDTGIEELTSYRKYKTKNRFVCAYINLNSVRNKLEHLHDLVGPLVDFLCIAETKIDKSFPDPQFYLEGFHKPFRLDKTGTSGGLLCYVRSDIPRRKAKCAIQLPSDIQLIPVELNLRKEKWLLISIYRPQDQKLGYLTKHLSRFLDSCAIKYDNVMVMGDFNDTADSTEISSLIATHDMTSLISHPTCFKSADGRCIDLILTNRRDRFYRYSSLETGLSDFHHLIYGVLKTTYDLRPPIIQAYRSYKNFSPETFRSDLCYRLNHAQTGSFSSFNDVFTTTLNEHAPLKSRILRGNHKPHVNKDLRKAIMKRSQLKNKANRTGLNADYAEYKKQRNLVTRLNRQSKKRFFAKLESKSGQKGNKDFWKACKPFFSQKVSPLDEKVSLIENDVLISNDQSIAHTFNHYFVNVAANLFKTRCTSEAISISEIIVSYADHPSVRRIKSRFPPDNFEFPHIEPLEVFKVISGLDSFKSNSGPIPAKVLKLAAEECCVPLTDCINALINDGVFPDELKLADVIPVHKRDETTCKENYRPISLLPILSKVLERILASHMGNYMEKKLSNLLCGFRSNHSTQHALFRLIQKWQSCLDKSGKVGTILMDLSKAFDSLPHDLLIAKLHAYGFSMSSLKLIYSFLTNRWQRTKIGSVFSSWLMIILGVPQGSVLGPLLFNFFINDLLLFIEKAEICNFADDNTLYCCSNSLDKVINSLEAAVLNCLSWFRSNRLVANPSKFQCMFLGVDNIDGLSLSVGELTVFATNCVRLLGIDIDNRLKFDLHIQSLCKQANQKVRSLYRIRKYLSLNQTETLCNAYVLSYFKYCPIIWMFSNKTLGNEVNKVQKRCMHVIYFDSELSGSELMLLHNAEPVHRIHLRTLLTEVFKSLHSLNPGFMKPYFERKCLSTELRDPEKLVLPAARTTKYGTHSFLFRSIILWNSLPSSIKKSNSLFQFKRLLKASEFSCTCHLCLN